jgi:hypothetical protein
VATEEHPVPQVGVPELPTFNTPVVFDVDPVLLSPAKPVSFKNTEPAYSDR